MKKTVGILVALGMILNSTSGFVVGPSKDGSLKQGEQSERQEKTCEQESQPQNVDSGKTALHIAVEENNKEKVRALLCGGADINAKDDNGQTPLHYALKKNNKEMGELLINKGADIEAKDNEGKTPLHYAAEKNNKEMGELLIYKGAYIEAKDNEGKTPLHYALKKNNKEMGELLINKGADIEAKDNEGKTPLYIAAEKNREEVVKLLLSKGASSNVKDKSGFYKYMWYGFVGEFTTDEIKKLEESKISFCETLKFRNYFDKEENKMIWDDLFNFFIELSSQKCTSDEKIEMIKKIKADSDSFIDIDQKTSIKICINLLTDSNFGLDKYCENIKLLLKDNYALSLYKLGATASEIVNYSKFNFSKEEAETLKKNFISPEEAKKFKDFGFSFEKTVEYACKFYNPARIFIVN